MIDIITLIPMYNQLLRNKSPIEEEFLDLRNTASKFDSQNDNSNANQRYTSSLSQYELLQNLILNMGRRRDDFEVRDRYFMLELPSGHNYFQRKKAIHQWLEKMVSGTVSIAFNYFYKEELTSDQTKIFCSENILRNITALKQKFKLRRKQLREIDRSIRVQIISYLLKKYPLTQKFVINRALDEAAEAENIIQDSENDFFYKSEIKFEYRESGNYNDLIKKTINQIISRLNKDCYVLGNGPNYKAFQKLMTGLFEAVEDEEFMNQPTKENMKENNRLAKITKGQIENTLDQDPKKAKYRQKIKEYTTFQIGRKISENVNQFSDKEIEEEKVEIKHPGILRILTKWSEQLEQKFTIKNYYQKKKQGLISKELFQIQDFYCKKLDEFKERQNTEIELFKTQIMSENYKHQIDLLEKLIEQIDQEDWTDNLEKVSAKFAVQMGKALENEIVKYLNRLIHGLLKVSNEWHKHALSRLGSFSYDYGHSVPPNLITFRIGDLVRCKCSSGERQILKIIQSLKQICSNQPNILQIIRIKNRLNQGTNDILINVRFCDIIIGEIQLAVNSKKTSFIKASANISHYLYELQRSLFGPIIEMCNIWRNLERRSAHFNNQKNLNSKKVMPKKHICQQLRRQQTFEVFQTSFQCSVCHTSYDRNNLIMKHTKCSRCDYWKCGQCRIKQSQLVELVELIADPNLQQFCIDTYEKQSKDDQLPLYGIALPFEVGPNHTATPFRKFKLNGKTYLCFFDGEVRELVTIRDENEETAFLSQYLIFEVDEKAGSHLVSLTQYQVKEHLLPKYFQHQYKIESNCLIIDNEPLNSENCEQVFESFTQKQTIQALLIRQTNITQITTLAKIFPQIRKLTLTQNSKLKSIEGLKNFHQLNDFFMWPTTQLQQFPQQLCGLASLKQLSLKANNFSEIPNEIGNLINLTQLNLSGNDGIYLQKRISALPIQLYELQALMVLDISNQMVGSIPEAIGDLNCLQFLNLRRNNIRILPNSINKLKLLTFLDFSNNPIEKLPNYMSNLNKLEDLQLKHFSRELIFDEEEELYPSIISELPVDIQQISNLTVIDVHSDELRRLPSLRLCKNLQEINFKGKNIDTLPLLPVCEKLKKFSFKTRSENENIEKQLPNYLPLIPNVEILALSSNLKKFPENISSLSEKLTNLDLSYNQLFELPDIIGDLTSLTVLNLRHNRLVNIPDRISQLKQLRSIYLSFNRLSVFPQQIIICRMLAIIELNANKIEVIPDSIVNLTCLQRLNLEKNYISIIPSKIEKLIKMKAGGLRLSYNPIVENNCQEFVKRAGCSKTKQIKENKDQYNKLKDYLQTFASNIKLLGIKLLYIPPGKGVNNIPRMKEFSQIETAVIDGNIFEVFPSFLTECGLLKVLKCSNNILWELPEEIGRLTDLTQINASKNCLTAVCAKIVNLTNLELLDLSKNKIECLPDLNGFRKLIKIELNNNKLTTFPKGLLFCLNLTEIVLSFNQIEIIDDDLSSLASLRSLSLNNNKISVFPEGVTKCPSLDTLQISNNHLNNISENIGNLLHLFLLNLQSNCIRVIPKSIGKCKKLQRVFFNNNQIEVAVRELNQLSDISTCNLDRNPLQTVECEQWLKRNKVSFTMESTTTNRIRNQQP